MIPTWRTAAMREEVRRVLPPKQRDRFLKIYEEPFFLIHPPAVTDIDASFLVSGSTQQRHTVRIDALSGAASCSCMDARINCRKQSCVCKHVCFVLFRVLRMSDLRFFGVDRGLRLSEQELRACLDTATRISEGAVSRGAVNQGSVSASSTAAASPAISPVIDPSVMHPPPPSCTGSDVFRSNEVFRDNVSESSECPVCYDCVGPLQNNALRGCPSCGNVVHLECMRRWAAAALASGSRVTCVMCRSAAWSRWDGR